MPLEQFTGGKFRAGGVKTYQGKLFAFHRRRRPGGRKSRFTSSSLLALLPYYLLFFHDQREGKSGRDVAGLRGDGSFLWISSAGDGIEMKNQSELVDGFFGSDDDDDDDALMRRKGKAQPPHVAANSALFSPSLYGRALPRQQEYVCFASGPRKRPIRG